MSILFPEKKITKILSIILALKNYESVEDIFLIDAVLDLCLFNYLKKSYLGFGFFLSFLEGTESYAARCRLDSQIKYLLLIARGLQSHLSAQFSSTIYNHLITETLSGIDKDWINFAFFWQRVDALNLQLNSNYFSFAPFAISPPFFSQPKRFLRFYESDFMNGLKLDFLFEKQTYLELQAYFIKPPTVNNFYFLLNPFRILEGLLVISHHLVLFFVELFNQFYLLFQDNKEPCVIYSLLKIILGTVFLATTTPVQIAKSIIDLTLNVVKIIVLQPFIFFLNAIYQCLEPKENNKFTLYYDLIQFVKKIHTSIQKEIPLSNFVTPLQQQFAKDLVLNQNFNNSRLTQKITDLKKLLTEPNPKLRLEQLQEICHTKNLPKFSIKTHTFFPHKKASEIEENFVDYYLLPSSTV